MHFPRFSNHLSISVCLGSALVFAGCGGGGSSAPSGDVDASGGSSSACEEVCAGKLAECGMPPGSGDPCALACASLTTSGEVACLSESSCLDLMESYDRGEIPCDGADGNGGGDVDGGGGGACEVGDPPRCDGNAVVTCEDIGGRPTVSTTTCPMYNECQDGECVSTLECLPIDARDCDPLNSGYGPGQCCDGAVCFGSYDENGEMFHRCCISSATDVACTEDAECCGYDPDAAFTFRCIGGVCQSP